MNELSNIYECQDLIRQVEELAASNDGEIPEDKLELLIQAQTTSLVKLEGLCNFLSWLNAGIDRCKQEEQRIEAMRKRAERKMDSVKRYLMPYVAQYKAEKGHPLTVGTWTLSTRKSTSVEIDEVKFNSDENREKWCDEKVTYQPRKNDIKTALQAGTEIVGASLIEKESLQIK